MTYFEDSSRFTTLIVIVKFLMVLSHGQLAVEHGFSTNNSLVIEKSYQPVHCGRLHEIQ